MIVILTREDFNDPLNFTYALNALFLRLKDIEKRHGPTMKDYAAVYLHRGGTFRNRNRVRLNGNKSFAESTLADLVRSQEEKT